MSDCICETGFGMNLSCPTHGVLPYYRDADARPAAAADPPGEREHNMQAERALAERGAIGEAIQTYLAETGFAMLSPATIGILEWRVWRALAAGRRAGAAAPDSEPITYMHPACAECGHSWGLHVPTLKGIRCEHEHHSQTTSGVIGLPVTTRCKCSGYAPAPGSGEASER